MNGEIPNRPEQTELPEPGNRCTDVLSDTLLGYAGIHQAEFDLQNGQFHITYDPHIMSDEHALSLVRKASERAYGRVMQCALKGDSTCSDCAAQMGSEIRAYYQRLAKLEGTGDARFKNGRMEVQLASNAIGLPGAELTVAEAIPAAPQAAPKPTRRVPRQRVEIILTVITALAALAAFLGQRYDLLPAPLTALLYGIAFVAGGYYGTLDGLARLREHRLDVNLLMVLAALGAAFIGQPAEGATLLFLFSLSNTLQSYAMDRSRQAIEKLLDLRPPVATVRRGSRLISLPVEKLVLGDTVLVRPGERFPIDGEVTGGSSAVDQSTITGESIPVEKAIRDSVFAGTVNGNGALEVRVTRLAQDTALAKIVQMVEDAQANKAQTQRMLDNFEQVYAILVLGGAVLLTVIPYFIFQQPFYPTFYRAMTWLVVASPCALVISTPASILSAIANGAKHGILFKGGVYLEQTALLKVVAFDKTGTLTTGTPALNRIVPLADVTADELLALAGATEARSEHPLARTIVKAAEERGLVMPVAMNFQAIPGQGVEAEVDGREVWIGSERLFAERRVHIPDRILHQAHQMEADGQTVMLVFVDGTWLGLLALADTLRPDAAQIVKNLKRLGVEHVVMLTGDNERVATNIATRAGVDESHAGLLPQDKVRLLKIMREKYGPTAMVGDGVNDAPALAVADVGVAMGGAGTDVALETADVVLMSDDLAKLPFAIGLSQKARRIVWENLTFALSVIVFLVISAFAAHLPLPLGVVGHEGSTVLVVLNGLRLLRYQG